VGDPLGYVAFPRKAKITITGAKRFDAWPRYLMRFILLSLSIFIAWAIPVSFVRAQELINPVTIERYDGHNSYAWGKTYDAIFYSWTASSTVTVCAVKVPISRNTDVTYGNEIPVTVGIVANSSTTPENTTFIANTNFSLALLPL